MERSPPQGTRSVLVLDGPEMARPLAEVVDAAGFCALAAPSLQALGERLGAAEARVAVIAFEALWPHPQEQLKHLRACAPGARLVVTYADGTPRLRLGHRLWEAGALDFFAARGMPPSDFGSVLRQAEADASQEPPTQAVIRRSGAPPEPRLAALTALFAAFGHQRTEGELIRELHLRLPAVLRYRLLLVAVRVEDRVRVHQLQTQPVEHRELWGLVEELCRGLGEGVEPAVSPAELEFEPPAPLSPEAGPARGVGRRLVAPLDAGQGGALGALAVTVELEDDEAQATLGLVACLFAAALRHVRMLQAAEAASRVDELTGCGNRRSLDQTLTGEWARCQRHGLSLSIALVDLDHLRRLNTLHGHRAGDLVLRRFAAFIQRHLRATDHLARYGGTEFVAVLPQTGPAEAAAVLERIRTLLAGHPLDGQVPSGPVQVSFSCGVAGFPACPAATAEDLIHLADSALATAKEGGGDRVCIAGMSRVGIGEAQLAHTSFEDPRDFPRISARMNVRFLELPDFEQNMARATGADLSAGGLLLEGLGLRIRKDAYALVYLEEAQKPLLTRVVWTADQADGNRRAGLRFVQAGQLDQLVRGEEPRTEHRAMVVAGSEEVRGMVGRVLRAARYEATFLSEGEALPSERLDQYDVLVLGDSALRGPVGEQLAQVTATSRNLRIVLVNEDPDRKRALEAIASHKVRHLVAAGAGTDEALFATLNKLLIGEIFGIRKYLLWGARSRAWEIVDRAGKTRVLEGISALAKEVGCHPRIADLFISAVDEMMINALYHAPASAEAGLKPVAVECGSDGRLLVVSVLDEHGRLAPSEIYAGLGRALRSGPGTPAIEGDHAHLGFRIMLGALSQLAVNVEPERRTELIGIVDLRKSLRELRESAPSFDVFTPD